MRSAIQEGENTEELRGMLAEYLENGENKTESETRFAQGYLSFLKGEQEQAAADFRQAKDKLQNTDSTFIKTYTYVFLNLLADENGQSNEFVGNCKNILFYMA